MCNNGRKFEMNIKRALVVFGNGPEAIKMVPVVKAFENDDRFSLKVCVTDIIVKCLIRF